MIYIEYIYIEYISRKKTNIIIIIDAKHGSHWKSFIYNVRFFELNYINLFIFNFVPFSITWAFSLYFIFYINLQIWKNAI